VRTFAVRLGLPALLFGLIAVPSLSGQGLFTDARRVGLGGVSLSIDGTLTRYNPAYRSVPPRTVQGGGGPKFSIPLPLGLIQFFHDHPNISKDPLFHPDSASFNPVELLDLVLTPPLYLEVKQVPTPTNDVAFGIGKDSLQVLLGAAQSLVPADAFGIRGESRPIDIEPSIKGFRFGVMVWLHDDVELQLGDSLLAFLKDGHPAAHNTLYNVVASATVEGGFAPSIGYSGKVYGDSSRSIYVGVAGHYYFGAAYGSSSGTAGFTTGDTIFAGPNIVTPKLTAQNAYSKWGNTMGHGVGADVGIAWVSGPIVFGVGVNDVGATITWPDTRIDYQRYDTTTKTVVTDSSKFHVETKTKLPVSYLANVIYSLGGTTVGADVLDNGHATILNIGAEQRFGPFALRGGISRDQRKLVEFAWGGGVRFGPLGLDVGFWTHSNALSDQRGITMATSLSIY